MPSNAAAFNRRIQADIDDWGNPREYIAMEVKPLLRRVYKRTPVRSGNLRSKWQLAPRLNNTLSSIRFQGRASLSIMLRFLDRWKKGKGRNNNLVLFNNVEYAAAVEDRTGFFEKALR